ncbi:uncharacterized aarF domain-containing protein kinase 5 [Cylas formicarius]|uniref:uncharacterized aarF domain-containing protein kinase 5 n=1 Tax=Cylas formicarius TaxID=197179 RepID=UPI002958CD52|nr:uncharacterized aarF domain-containing protein kinase 5 [Cylas formicarius]XP_060519463.1 uncharacterized aarF domain-containing protein kinase 5 [Cylas formicarius]XP_060519464.1 uncharacterized aarF domain-containing protein kinase 5 [Cylas formicarius]XP_060519465.1 uncharacterized aarF domain-containing protein kinase 5 [Cylas formicarius]
MTRLASAFIKCMARSKKGCGKYSLASVSGVAGLGALLLTREGKNDDDNIVLGTKGLLRFVRSVRIGLTITLDYYVSMQGLTDGKPNYDVMMSRIHRRCAERIRDGCLQNGGTYVKLGQGLVSLSHILPKEYIDSLKILQDKCLKREKDELYQIFEEDFGQKPEELFQSFDIEPIAAASIAQVFKATTRDGQEVAIKVQYKDLRRRLNGDILTLKILLKTGTWFHPKVDLSWIVDEFRETLSQELDFINEGLNGERCARDLHHLKYVYIPTVLWNYTSPRILVTEFIDAIKINNLQALKQNGFSLADINNKMFEAFGYQIFKAGFVHADPHPGNVMVRRQNGKTELIILDHGLYQEVLDTERIALSHMWKAIVLGDHRNMRKYSNILGVEDYEKFAEILTQAPLKSRGFKLKKKLSEEDLAYMQQQTAEHFDEITRCLQQMPKTLILVVRNLNTLRAISFDHGSPVDRYAILARMASKAAFDDESKGNGKIKQITVKLWFELALIINKFVTFWRIVLVDIFYKLGLIPNIKPLIDMEINRQL